MEEDGPDARNAPVMAFDSIRNRTVLFGGWAPGEPATHLRGDTWEWDGTRWTQVADTGPEARFGAAMASTGGSLVLHGGMSTQPIGDSWQWVHSTWSKVTELGPGARYVHSMTYDTDRARVVLFGGQHIASGQAGGYARDGDTWEAPAIPGPVPSGPGPDNLMVSPGIVSLSQGPAPVIEFDTASSNATRHFLIYLINAAGQRVPIDDGVIVPGQTHAAHQVPKNSLAMGMNQLGLLAPVDAAFSTDLGTNFVVFHIVG